MSVLQQVKKQRRGAIVPLVAIFLPVLLVLSGFAINLAYVELTRTQLRISTDAASRAAGHKLVTTGSTTQARAAARDASQRNLVAGEPLQLADEDIVFGVSTRSSATSRYAFTAGASPPNSVQILGKRTSSSQSGSVSLIVPMVGNTLTKFDATQRAVSTQVELDIVLVLDRSGSMAYGTEEESDALYAAGIMPAGAPPGWNYCDAIPAGSRWLDLDSAVQVFHSVLNNTIVAERVGLATYSSDASADVQLTSNYSQLTGVINNQSQSFCGGATNVGSGITAGLGIITDSFYGRDGAVKVMIVMTDGRHNTGPEPAAAAQSVADAGVMIYTITFSAEAEQQRMIDVAAIGDGEHHHANTAAELREAFEKIASSLPTLLTE